MEILSNAVVFPLIQLALLALLLWALWNDRPRGGGLSMVVTRAKESMDVIERAVGAIAVAVLTIVDKTVFDADPFWARCAAFITAADLLAVLYVCYVSAWGRSFIIGFHNRRKEERRS